MRISALVTFLVISVNAQDIPIEKICIDLGLVPAAKAIVQWERVFSSERRMKRYQIDKLPKVEQKKLKVYLVKHAADSNQPMVPGL